MATETRTFRAGIAAGVVLVILGIGAYVLTDFASVTAVIPAVFGLLFVAIGRAGPAFDRERVATFVIGVLALLGFAGSTRGLVDAPALLTGGDVDSPVAVGSQTVMALVCLALLVLVALSVIRDRQSA